ncbi:hypothetical protein [Brevundimonas sp. LPMIX5]|uniref:hypothetical protein n=1 Tax=Brevundimonas sp. LPMIX5 TaxID=2305887 RepID=UPI001314581F|nr:hypothetical protein [Brevundimonas sp. LPMIX5]
MNVIAVHIEADNLTLDTADHTLMSFARDAGFLLKDLGRIVLGGQTNAPRPA